MTTLRKLIAALCLVAVVALAISPVAPGILIALLVPLFFFLAPVAIALTSLKSEDEQVPAFQFSSVSGTRGPPNA